MELIDLVVLSRVIERGSFAKAAPDFGVPASTLSRRVAALERRLGVRVLERTTRHLRPTEIGEALAERGARIRREIEEAERAAADHQRTPRGVLRLSVPTPAACGLLGPVLAAYLRRFPEMRVEIVAEDRMVDLVAEGFDAALRLGKLPSSPLGAVRIASVGPVLAAAPLYLDRAPPLRAPRDLSAHAVVVFGRKRHQTWTFARGAAIEEVEVVARAASDSAPLVAELAAAGAGLALIPRFIADAAQLTVLEPGGFRPRTVDMSVVVPSARARSTKVRVFLELLRGHIAAHPELFDAAVDTTRR